MTMSMKLRGLAALIAITLALTCCGASWGQVIKGSISGTVLDPQGAVVSGAQVKAKNVETGVVFTTTTDSSGLFRFNLLPVGTYNVEIAHPGFKTAENKGMRIDAGSDSGLGTVHLTVGETSTTIEVSGAAPLIEASTPQVSNVFSGITLSQFAGIEENEGLDRLALFVPGVASSRSNNFSNTNGVGFSSNGLRGRNNDQEIDGQQNNDNSVGGPALFLSNPEFVQQYVIITNNFGPEYGRNAGSVVNIITKSGTNSWHGVLFGSENNSFLNALSNTQHNTPKPGSITTANPKGTPFTGPPRSNDEFAGGAIGGPIVKNKWFLFGGFDEELIAGNGVFTTTNRSPTPAGLAHLGGCAVNAQALATLSSFGPYAFGFGNPTPRSPSFTSIGTCTNPVQGFANSQVEVAGVTRVLPIPFHGFDWIMRSDVQLGGDTLTARYLLNRNNTFNSGDNSAAGWFINIPDFNQSILVSETHNFTSRMVNEARVSFARLGVEFGGGLNPFEPVAGQLNQALANVAITGFLGFGPATNLPQSRLVNSWQAQDNWNYVKGKHSFKAGVNWTYLRSPNIFLPNINGAYRFASLNSFLTTDIPNRIIIGNGNPNLDFREKDIFLFVGDDWKIGQSLTLNLGVTWTYYGSPADLFNRITVPRETNPSTAFWLQSLALPLRTNPTTPSIKNSFGPSVGFAYSPGWGGFLTGHGKTVFRGGYRLLYDPPFYNIFVNISSSAPMTFLQTILDAPTLNAHPLPAVPTGPNVRASLASTLAINTFDPRTLNETNLSSNFGPDKVHSWSFGVERELSKNAVLEARYVGNHAVNLFQTVDANPFAGTAASHGLLQDFPSLVPNASSITPCAATTQSGPGAGTDVGRVSCGLGVARSRTNGAFSDYHALQVQFRANDLFKQLTMQAGYTWSKNLDNVSEIFSTGSAGNTLFAAQNPFQTGEAERSISGLNYPHVFSVLFIERLPFFKEQHGFAGHLLGGWAISADYLLASGQPYTPSQGNIFAAVNSAVARNGDYFDNAFAGAFVGDPARPFFGNPNAAANTVGIYCGDLRSLFGISAAGAAAFCAPKGGLTQLLSFNALNQPGLTAASVLDPNGCLRGNAVCPFVAVTTNDVRYIINMHTAQGVFGTPFGTVPRNPATDAISNILNFSLYKTFKFTERTSFEIHATALNALNHFNFTSIDPNMENAGLQNNFGSGFANPATTTANGRTFFVGAKFRF